MITLDTVRAALLAEQPWSEMDRLVRAELASGRRTNQVLDELVAMTGEVRGTPGFGEQSEEVLGDTLDRLSGFCMASQAYRNPPTLPTEEEVAKLPRWARVAFAARCARRVSTLLPLYGEGQGRFTVDTYFEIVDAVEIAAEQGVPPVQLSESEATHLSVAFWENDPLEAVTGAVMVALNISRTFPHDELLPGLLRRVVDAARTLADITASIRRDLDHLTAYSDTQSLTDQSPVPLEVFGPMWPDGPPAGWPTDPNALHHSDIALAVESRDGLDERIVEDEVVNLFNAMNRYHIARGGKPLALEDFQPLIPALVPAGV